MRPDLDITPWAVALALAGAAFGPKFAAYISAYGLILIGWFAGLLYGLYTRSLESKLPVWAYSLFTLIVCLMVTVPASQLAVAAIPGVQVEHTSALFVVSALISALPDYWGRAGAWILEKWQVLRGIKQ